MEPEGAMNQMRNPDRDPAGGLESLVQSLARERITRSQFIKRAALLGLSASAVGTVLAACGSGKPDSTPSAMDTTVPEVLHYYSWAEYIDPKVKQAFTKKTGIKVLETDFNDMDALYAKAQAQGGELEVDVIVPSDYMVSIMRKSHMLQPLDMSYIPNFQYVSEQFRKPTFDPETDGNKYSIPYMWGSMGIGVRVDKVKEPITGWANLWEKQYKGQINMQNSSRPTVGAALKLLGYSLNSTDETEISAAADKLIEQKPLVAQYDSVSPYRNMAMGVPLVHCWSGEVIQAINYAGASSKDLKYVAPSEGYMLFVDNYCIPKGAPSPYAAHLFMDFILDPKIETQNASWIGFFPPEDQAMAGLDPLTRSLIPDAATLALGEVTDDVGEADALYTDAWRRVKSA
jgi:spermidine/putrescine transport system substrate-binding protein